MPCLELHYQTTIDGSPRDLIENIETGSNTFTGPLDKKTGTIVIHNPADVDKGTTYRPGNGNLKKAEKTFKNLQ